MTDPDEAIVVIDGSTLGGPDLSTIDTLARLALDARRRGRRIVLREPGRSLRDLLSLVGLAGVVAMCPDQPELSVELQGKPEDREQARVEEVRDVGDQPT